MSLSEIAASGNALGVRRSVGAGPSPLAGRPDEGWERGPEAEKRLAVLSPREREIVSLVTLGYKNRQLAEKLSISGQTVKNHMHNIFKKLDIPDRLELVLFAIYHQLHKRDPSPASIAGLKKPDRHNKQETKDDRFHVEKRRLTE